jgi:hypothetical protein
LQIKLGLKITSRCGLTIKEVSGTFFYEMEQDIKRFLGSLQPEFDVSFRTLTDSYGYLWIILEGSRIEDLLAGLTAVGDTVEEKGFSDQLLAAVFEFENEREGGFQYLIYNYRRNNFYPFVPTGHETRNNEEEMKLMSTLAEEMPFEKDTAMWYPLWDLPLRARG